MSDAYSASHAPVLVLLPLLTPIMRVLELGAGAISTRLFVDAEVYPDLTALDSLDNGPAQWRERCRSFLPPHSTIHQLHESDQPMHAWASTFPLESYDLILVDDSHTAEERARTIAAVTARPLTRTIVVIHDFEHAPYQQAVVGEGRRFIFDGVLPHTAVFWRARALAETELAFWRMDMHAFFPQAPDHGADGRAWRAHFLRAMTRR